jgi:hypothetical protein
MRNSAKMAFLQQSIVPVMSSTMVICMCMPRSKGCHGVKLTSTTTELYLHSSAQHVRRGMLQGALGIVNICNNRTTAEQMRTIDDHIAIKPAALACQNIDVCDEPRCDVDELHVRRRHTIRCSGLCRC